MKLESDTKELLIQLKSLFKKICFSNSKKLIRNKTVFLCRLKYLDLNILLKES